MVISTLRELELATPYSLGKLIDWKLKVGCVRFDAPVAECSLLVREIN